MAPGRIVVSDRTKVVQPLEAGVIKAIHVRDGDFVQAGQLLIELDPTSAAADSRAVQQQAEAAAAEAARATALLAALQGKPLTANPADPQLQAEWRDLQSRLARLDAEIIRREAETVTVQEGLTKLQTTLPLARQREADFKALTGQGFISSHAGQDRSRDRIEQERDLATQQARLRESQAALAESHQGRQAYLAEALRSLNDRLAKAKLESGQLIQQGAKAHGREQLMRLTAPVAGTVQQLAVHTSGGVVTTAQALLVVVPKGAAVSAEVQLANTDIGFVRAGQRAKIKVEAFTFTKYGLIDAQVERISADAVQDEQRGAIFPAILALRTNHIEIEKVNVPITPGMTVSAEILTQRRRALEYFLDPVMRTIHSSLRER